MVLVEGGTMKDKIANKIIKAIYMHQDTSLNIVEVGNEIADQILSLLKEEGWKSPGEIIESQRGLRSEWFNKGRESIFRKNDSGCVCSMDEEGNITSLCAAHQDYFDEMIKAKGYLHKDDPTDVMVDGKPLTVGEVLEKAKLDT